MNITAPSRSFRFSVHSSSMRSRRATFYAKLNVSYPHQKVDNNSGAWYAVANLAIQIKCHNSIEQIVLLLSVTRRKIAQLAFRDIIMESTLNELMAFRTGSAQLASKMTSTKDLLEVTRYLPNYFSEFNKRGRNGNCYKDITLSRYIQVYHKKSA